MHNFGMLGDWLIQRNLKQRMVDGLRQNLLPGLILWFFGLSMVMAYYFIDSTRPYFLEIIKLKETYGYIFSAVSTSFFGGLIPYLFMRLSGRDKNGNFWMHGIIFLIYWAFRGVDVDTFYRLQSWMFGNTTDARTIFLKVLVDQLIYCVFWANPVTALFFAWKEVNFSFHRLRKEKKWAEILDVIVIFAVSTWMVWIPATAIIYSLPGPLQIPLFNLTLCFFVILVSVFGNRDKA